MSDRLDEQSLRSLVADNAGRFDALVDDAARAAARRPTYAAAVAQAAAQYAWFHHTGAFASAPLEEVLARLGSTLPTVRASPGGGTLHVATQMYQTGGSTQAIASWTDELSDRGHHVVLTGQRGTPVPEKIRRRLGARVRLSRLDTSPGGLLRRAARLRRLAASADLVLVHAHPHDVVPALAFSRRDDLPTVVYVDHADHVFWVGVSATDHVMHMRHSGQQLALRRRGLAETRSLVLNRPLAVRTRTVGRETAKAAWGLTPDQVLVVTAADGSKFESLDGPSLADLVEPVVRSRPGLHWMVAGASPDAEPWASLARRTDGRARAVGTLRDMASLHQAADVYLDSFPFASLTSMLESGAFGNPLVTYRGHPESCGVYGADSPGIDELMRRPASPAALRETLLELADGPDVRARLGEATATAVVESHTGPGWREAVSALDDLGPERTGLLEIPRLVEPVDLLAASVQARNPFARSVEATLAGQLGVMPAREKIRVWLTSRRVDGASVKSLAPDWAVATVRARRTG